MSAAVVAAAVTVLLVGLTCFVLLRENCERKLRALQKSSLPWIWGSTAVFLFSVSGGAYIVAQKPALFGVDPESGRWIFLAPDSSSQYALEGLAIGLLQLCCAVAIVVVARATRLSQRYCPGNAGVVAAVGIACFSLAFTRIMSLYSHKNPWYGESTF